MPARIDFARPVDVTCSVLGRHRQACGRRHRAGVIGIEVLHHGRVARRQSAIGKTALSKSG